MHSCEDFIMQMEWSSPSRLAVEALRADGEEADIEIVEEAVQFFDWYPESSFGTEERVKRKFSLDS